MPFVFHFRGENIADLSGGDTHYFVQRRLKKSFIEEDGWALIHARLRLGAKYQYVGAAYTKTFENLGREGHFAISLSDYLGFETAVPSRIDGLSVEPAYHGLQKLRDHAREARTVRPIPWRTYEQVIQKGLSSRLAGGFQEVAATDPWGAAPGRNEAEAKRRVVQVLTSRAVRDASNRSRCLAAYSRCAISGEHQLLPEGGSLCDAAHIQAVGHGGPDHIGNLILLRKDLHAAFEHGLIGIGDDYSILRSAWLRPGEFCTPLNATGQLLLPVERGLWPDLRFIRWHRERKFQKAEAPPFQDMRLPRDAILFP